MIKPEELRIGNYVTDDDNFIYTVKGVKGNSIDTTGDEKYHDMFFFNPIPLSEEWLLMLGFEKNGPGFEIENEKYIFRMLFYDCWHIDYREKESYGISDCSVGTFVDAHQLQNLYYALTGEELTLKE